MIRSAFLVAALGVSGCSQSPEPPARAAVDAGVAIKPEPLPATPQVPVKKTDAAVPQPPPPKPPETPTAFEYPADLGGKAVAKAVAPDRPALTADRAAPAPKLRVLPAKFRDPDATTKVSYALPPIPHAKPAVVRLVAPPERVPVDLGRGFDAIPSRPTFPVAAGITERAPDVKIPPAMPTLGRPLAERVGLDDPTSELANAGIVAPPVKVAVAQSPFLKVSLPDPFELGTQVKPTVPPAAEPGLAPVVVDPQRVK
jgi:hypothetical protein